MTQLRPRIAVIGAGTIGSQTLWQLSRLDCDVTGYELFSPGHSRGAGGGESRLFRRIEIEDLRYQPILDRADELWKELETITGQKLRDISGALTFTAESSPATPVALQSAALLGDRVEVMTAGETRARFPMYETDPDEIVILDKGAGTIFPEKTIRTAAAAAKANGAVIHTEARVTGIVQEHDTILVTADGLTRQYDRVIVAAGAWTAALLPDMAPYLATRRLLSTWFLPRTGASLAGMLPYIRTEPNYSYGLPTADGLAMKLGLGFANHLPVDSPDTARMNVTEEDLLAVRGLVRRFLPHLEDYPMRMSPYFEAYTHDRHEYIGRHPSMPGVLVLAGFSGKGFKTSPVIGELAAREVLGLEPKTDAGFLLANPPRAANR